jgi:hypothetical protein
MTPSPRRHRGPAGAFRTTLSRGVTALRWLAFWSAVAFPLVYLLALVPGEPVVVSVTELVAAVAVHAVALLVGHGHVPAGANTRPTDRSSTASDDRAAG